MKKGWIMPPVTYETAGELHRGADRRPERAIEVDYELFATGPDDAGGRIRIGDDPTPADQFMGGPASVFTGNQIYVLQTASGHEVRIFFTNADGTFVCQLADEAQRALDAAG